MTLVRFIFSNFWVWLGAALLLALPFETIVKIVRLLVRRANIEKQGWPPAHLDADGDFKNQEKEKP
jgi:hypothetical protein